MPCLGEARTLWVCVSNTRSPRYRARLQACEATWLPRFRAMGFPAVVVLGRNSPSKSGRMIVDAGDYYRSLPQKVAAVFAHAVANDYDYVVKVDDDVVVYDRLAEVEAGEYVGVDFNLGKAAASWLAGFCYCVGRRAMSAFLSDHGRYAQGPEDEMLGATCRRHGIAMRSDARFVMRYDARLHGIAVAQHGARPTEMMEAEPWTK